MRNPITVLKKRRTELQARLNGLIKMRADGEVNKEQFEAFKADLVHEVSQIEEKLHMNTNLENHVDIDTQDYFDFAYHSISEYEKDDPITKTLLLSKLGSNLTLMNKNLVITTEKTFKRIKECDVIYCTQILPLEPNKTFAELREISNYYPAFKLLCPKLKAIRTCLIAKALKKIEENLKKY